MTPARKHKMFDLLVQMGYKEIEIGFPSASQNDFDFVRQLIEQDKIPDDVIVSVLTQAREDLIERTAESLVGAKRGTIHMYNATAPLFRRVVFHVDKAECIALATRGTELVMKYAEQYLGDVEFGYEYSPEIFTGTEMEFAVEVCNAVMDVWQPSASREIILNLRRPSDSDNCVTHQIEWLPACPQPRARRNLGCTTGPRMQCGDGLAMIAGADRSATLQPRRHRQCGPGHWHKPVLAGQSPKSILRIDRSLAPWSTAESGSRHHAGDLSHRAQAATKTRQEGRRTEKRRRAKHQRPRRRGATCRLTPGVGRTHRRSSG
jgi:hypothetical protein